VCTVLKSVTDDPASASPLGQMLVPLEARTGPPAHGAARAADHAATLRRCRRVIALLWPRLPSGFAFLAPPACCVLTQRWRCLQEVMIVSSGKLEGAAGDELGAGTVVGVEALADPSVTKYSQTLRAVNNVTLWWACRAAAAGGRHACPRRTARLVPLRRLLARSGHLKVRLMALACLISLCACRCACRSVIPSAWRCPPPPNLMVPSNVRRR
jgi:hypothetical protein